jgi:hypothetical protein
MGADSVIPDREAAAVVRDWLTENRDAIEAGGDGDVDTLVDRLRGLANRVPCPRTQPA